MAIDADSFSDIADELLQNFEPKKCMPDDINSKEEHEEYLKAIGYEKYVKDLQHFKDSSVGLNVTDKPIGDLLQMFWQGCLPQDKLLSGLKAQALLQGFYHFLHL